VRTSEDSDVIDVDDRFPLCVVLLTLFLGLLIEGAAGIIGVEAVVTMRSNEEGVE
jgi:hypothetical protein